MMKIPLLPLLCLVGATVAAVSGCSSSQPNLTPPAAVTSDPGVGRILAESCYHCHSSEGAGEWYAKLQPSRWFGNPGLDALNFSAWGTYDAQRRKDAIRQIAAVVHAGTMPPKGYLLFHPQARLSAEQKEAIARWAATEGALTAH
jgi:hypothetical protein